MSKLFATKHATVRHNLPALLTLLGLTQALVVASLGCRSTSDNQIDLLERELRTQEDYIYELESYVVEYSEKLRDTRCDYPQQAAIYSEELRAPEPAPAPKRNLKKPSLRRDEEALTLETDADDLPAPSERQPSPAVTPDELTPDEVSPEEMEVPDEIEFEIESPLSETTDTRPLRQVAAVTLELPNSDDGRVRIPDPLDYGPDRLDYRSSRLRSDRLRSDQLASDRLASNPLASAIDASRTEILAVNSEQPAESLFDDERVEETVALVDREIEHLQVTRLFQNDGDEQQSLLTVVEALDANGEPVDLDGEVSLMVMTAGDDARRRLKRWNFTSQETVSAWQSSDLGDGLHLELPLEKLRLPATPLELWVRLVTVEGRKLLTQLPFDAHQLPSVATPSTEQPSAGLSLATEESPAEVASARSAPSQISSSLEINSIPNRQRPASELVERAPPANQPRWRSSMQRTDQTATGFAATSQAAQGWTTQSPGRQPYPTAQVANRTLPVSQTSLGNPIPSGKPKQVASRPPSQPVWTSGRTELPAAAPTSSPASGTTPATWSISR